MKIIYIDDDNNLLSLDNKKIIFFIPEKREKRSLLFCFTFFFTSVVLGFTFTMFILNQLFTKEELMKYTIK